MFNVEALGIQGGQDKHSPCCHADSLLSPEPDAKQIITYIQLIVVLISIIYFFCVPRSQFLIQWLKTD